MTPITRSVDYNEPPSSHRCSPDGACRHPGAGSYGSVYVRFQPWWALAGWPENHVLAELVGVSVRTVCRWASRDAIPFAMSDKCACAIGLHVANVWGEEWWAAA